MECLQCTRQNYSHFVAAAWSREVPCLKSAASSRQSQDQTPGGLLPIAAPTQVAEWAALPCLMPLAKASVIKKALGILMIFQ